MNNNCYTYSIGCLIMALFLSFSCKHKESKYHSLTDKIEEESKDFIGTDISLETLLEEMKLLEIHEEGHAFLIPERKGQLKSYACSECHTKPLASMTSLEIGKKAHWNVKLAHADNLTMNCITCHSESNLDELTSLTGSEIDFDASYKLCSQCHTAQFKDWTGGAHGKKIAGWAPPRASMTCVNCHNPHSPSFDTRWPSRFNTQMEKERKEGLSH
ncbi:cytochrome c3 family protein [Flagellimonas algicola]|uniref:Cytochrome C n=1 Tax=Flagellimonas algicola TaxID=2583815 RepID=A0ABY2WMB9_9FLAO|nr:cytochrome c3 family protein [Allomuricauda algicola]TMU56143.1 cytochrome C [Allomuricauda algicola]